MYTYIYIPTDLSITLLGIYTKTYLNAKMFSNVYFKSFQQQKEKSNKVGKSEGSNLTMLHSFDGFNY